MRNDADMCGLSRKIWGVDNEEVHTDLTELLVRPSNGQDAQAVGCLISVG